MTGGETPPAGPTLRDLCRDHTALDEADIEALERVAGVIATISRLDDTDVFIDCLCRDGSGGLVVAEARASGGKSVYAETVAGKPVLPDREPAVFQAFASGMPVRDTIGVTQENRTVSQAAVPIRNPAGKVVGVLIQERDVSDSVNRDKRYRQLARQSQEQKELLSRLRNRETVFVPEMDDGELAIREIHHRVKNNLQLIASMLNLQARNTPSPEVRKAFRENVGRILSIASIYDELTLREGGEAANGEIFLLPILEKVCYTVIACSNSDSRTIMANVGGDDIVVDNDKATHIALVVNELVMNAVKHAFAGRDDGLVRVAVARGNTYSTVTVSDNGAGIPDERAEKPEGLGMNIVRSLVAKMGGTLQIASDDGGSRVTFDFLM